MVHKSLTLNRVLRAAKSGEYVGFCKACGKKAYGVEPDARGYKCEHCDLPMVYGAEELLIEMA